MVETKVLKKNIDDYKELVGALDRILNIYNAVKFLERVDHDQEKLYPRPIRYTFVGSSIGDIENEIEAAFERIIIDFVTTDKKEES